MRPHATSRTIERVRPFLALGLVACAAVVLALCFRLGADAAETALEPSYSVGMGPGDRARVDLHATSRLAARESVAAGPAEPGVAAARSRIADVGYSHVHVPEDVDGIVEVLVVRDEDGSPVENATVRRSNSSVDETLTTDANGVASFTGASTGRSMITAETPGRPKVIGSADVTRREPRTRVELRVYVEHELVVRLFDPAGEPFRAENWQMDRQSADRFGVLVTARCGLVRETSSNTEAPVQSARRIAADGAVAWRVVTGSRSGGCVQVALGDVIVGTASVGAGAGEVALRVDASALDAAMTAATVCVVDDATGAPIAGASVEFPIGSMADSTRISAHDGCARARFAPVGATNVRVRARGYSPARIVVPRESGSTVVARMVRARRVAGVVVDSAGTPVPNAHVRLARSEDGEGALARTSADGTFEFEDVDAVVVRVGAVEPNRGVPDPSHAAVDVDASAGDVLDVRIVFLPKAERTPRKSGTPRRGGD